jgi:hypothetical protein
MLVMLIHYISQEKLLVETTRWELLACVGAWGTLFAGAQVSMCPSVTWHACT